MKRIALFLALIVGLCFLSLPEADAGGCNTCYQQVQVQYVYRDNYIPVAVPYTVAVPVVSYLHNGYPAYQAVQALPAPAPQVVQPQAQAKKPDSGLTDEQIDAIITRIEARLNAKNGSQPEAKNPPPAVKQDVVSVLRRKLGNEQKSCADCHSGPNAKGGLTLILADGRLNPAVDWFKAWDKADGTNAVSSMMPPEARTNPNAALSDEEVNVLREYARNSVANRR